MCPWADVLYGCDGAWWKLHQGVPEFQGLKLTQDSVAAVQFPDVHKVELTRQCSKILTDVPGVIGAGAKTGGGNSGFHALNIAVQFGARRIVLIGFDMRLDHGVHWHGRHANGLNNPREKSLINWRRSLNDAAQPLADIGVEVLNASAVSTLTAFPNVDLREAIAIS